jgi:hypothetical protein
MRDLAYYCVRIPARVARVFVKSGQQTWIEADLEYWDERPAQVLERVTRERNEP